MYVCDLKIFKLDNYLDKLQQLKQQLLVLQNNQEEFGKQIHMLKLEIFSLEEEFSKYKLQEKPAQVFTPVTDFKKPEEVFEEVKISQPTENTVVPEPVFIPTQKSTNISVEKFIGENLISKVGILILIIGLSIGVKYSIDHQLISPMLRLILGYLSGFTLLLIGFKLKAKYFNYSAILVSGAIAVLYFMNFATYGIYNFIPQWLSFVLLFVCSVFAVICAIYYNTVIIALIGLVGAYVVPFLIGENTGEVDFLFSYFTVINTAILVVSVKKNWQLLNYFSYIFTWLFILLWYAFNYQTSLYFYSFLSFISVTFLLFYLQFIWYKIKNHLLFVASDVVLILSNTFLFYAIGFSIIKSCALYNNYLGAFTIFNALLQFFIAKWVFAKKLADKNLFYLSLGLVFTFITLAIAVELNGSWITLFWLMEALILNAIAQKQKIDFYEKISIPLIILSFLSLLQDWANGFDLQHIAPFANWFFCSSVVYACILAVIVKIQFKNSFYNLSKFLNPALLIAIGFFTFYRELVFWFNSLVWDAKKVNNLVHAINIKDIYALKSIVLIVFTLFFAFVIDFINQKKLSLRALQIVSFVLILLSIGVYFTQGQSSLSVLQNSYLQNQTYLSFSLFNVWVRFFTYAAVFFSILQLRKIVLQIISEGIVTVQILLQFFILWILSFEVNYLSLSVLFLKGNNLTLTILWTIFAVYLIVLGIVKKASYYRIAAMFLLGITVLKLIFFDLANFNTIAKTIVFIAVGVLLLIISFIYNKYKHLIDHDKQA